MNESHYRSSQTERSYEDSERDPSCCAVVCSAKVTQPRPFRHLSECVGEVQLRAMAAAPRVQKKGKKELDKEVQKQGILADRVTFPRFSRLPRENNFPLEHYRFTSDGSCVRSRTWCFVGEIALDVSLWRRSLLIKDRAGYKIPLHFYPETGSFDYSSLKEGRTVVIMLAKIHLFMDGTIGIRLENLETIIVVKCNLDDLFEMSKCYAKRGEKQCWNEDCEEETLHPESLMKCSSCKFAFYCDRKCQSADWKERHSRWCKALPTFVKIASLDYNKIHSSWK